MTATASCPGPPAEPAPFAEGEGPLGAAFYARPVLEVARNLIGCTVAYRGRSGVIVETEAYHESEPACHAYVGLTPRTSTLFGPPGRAYVYQSYGIHALLNAVCEPEGVGAAVLIRALEPLRGITGMRSRRALGGAGVPAGATPHKGAETRGRRRELRDEDLCSGPGKLTQALGVSLSHNEGDLRTGPIRILAPEEPRREPEILVGRRIGITKAAELPWRFCMAANPHVSSPRAPVA